MVAAPKVKTRVLKTTNPRISILVAAPKVKLKNDAEKELAESWQCQNRTSATPNLKNRRETQVEDIPRKTQFNAETKKRQIIRALIFILLYPLCKNRAETFSEIKSPDTQIQIQIHMTRPSYDCKWANAEIQLSNQHTRSPTALRF